METEVTVREVDSRRFKTIDLDPLVLLVEREFHDVRSDVDPHRDVVVEVCGMRFLDMLGAFAGDDVASLKVIAADLVVDVAVIAVEVDDPLQSPPLPDLERKLVDTRRGLYRGQILVAAST